MRKRKIIMSEEISVMNVFDSFVTEQQVRGNSKYTIRSYREAINKFLSVTNIHYITEVNKTSYETFINLLGDTDVKSTTVASHAKKLKAFINWCIDNEYVESFKMTNPKSQKVHKPTYTDEELKLLLKKPTKKDMLESFSTYRTWVIVNYLMATGNRASSIINLKVNDLDLIAGYATLRHTKNKQPQIVPLVGTLVKILGEYINLAQLKSTDWLFPSVYDEQLTARALYLAINKYNSKRGVNRKGVHLFRHTFAKNYIMNGGDAFSLQRMLGHHDLDMVNEYMNLYTNDVKNLNDKFNPLDSLIARKTQRKL